jgi:hypothetical protein
MKSRSVMQHEKCRVAICSPSRHVGAALFHSIRTLDTECEVVWRGPVENLHQELNDDEDRDLLRLLRHYPSRTRGAAVVEEHSCLRQDHRWQGVFIALVDKDTAADLAAMWNYGINIVATDDLRTMFEVVHSGTQIMMEQWMTSRQNEPSVMVIREGIQKALAYIDQRALPEAAEQFRRLHEPLLHVDESIISHSEARFAKDLALSDPSLNVPDLERIGQAFVEWARRLAILK